VGLIASKNPSETLVRTVQSLFRGGCTRAVVVDDGSDKPESMAIFDRVEELGATVIHLEHNIGKARALKAGFHTLEPGCVIVQTDDDTVAGNLAGPLAMIQDGITDIVDIRIEVMRTSSMIGLIQEFGYWAINALAKRVQNWLRARTWISGASVMYSYDAGVVLIQEDALSITEDTEGLFRARKRGFRVRYYSRRQAQFLTMVPEDVSGLLRQWQRWATGNGQIIRRYGLGGGNVRVALVNLVSWLLVLAPALAVLNFGTRSLMFILGGGLIYGVTGAAFLKRPRVIIGGLVFPIISLVWMTVSLLGLWRAWHISRTGASQLTWVSPKRTEARPHGVFRGRHRRTRSARRQAQRQP
jgi:cellulose synthase/poly-beta-1,6-N-acetylglucosamine synthase-like glycosyltransferase